MAVVGSNLTKGSTVASQSTFTTASVTPTGNNLILITVATRTASGAPNDPTITGNGLTWVKIASNIYDDTGSQRKVSVFRAMGASPSTGAITIDFAGQNQSSCDWVVDQFSGVDTSGTNGSGAIVPTNIVNGNGGSQVGVTSLTLTLATPGSTNNVAFGGFGAGNGASITLSVGTGFTQLGNQVDSGPENGIITEYKLNTTSVPANVTPSNFMGGVAVEIKASTDVTTTKTQTGKARITQITPQTQTGKANAVWDKTTQYDHVVFIIMENTNYANIIGNTTDAPYINNTLLPLSASLTNYFALDHPSLGNYLGLISGNTQGQDNGSDPNVGPPNNLTLLGGTNLVDRLENASISWKAYMEAMPSDWYTKSGRTMGDTGGNDFASNPKYQEHHNPFVYFSSNNNTNSNTRLTKIVPYTQFATDLAVAGGTGLPKFSWITPEMDHDMHDALDGSTNAIKAGDNFLSTLIPSILTSDAFTKQRSLLILTWDEDENNGSGNKVACIITGYNVRQNVTSSNRYDHYTTLRTIEAALGHLTPIQTDATKNSDLTATIFSDIFLTSKDQTGVARIQLITTKTQTAKSRITAVVAKTQAAVANIKNNTLRLQTAAARILRIVPQTITGISRITQLTTRATTGIARVTDITQKLQTGISRLTQTTSKIIIGVSRITITTSRTIAGVGRVVQTTLKTQTGKARVTKLTLQTQTGVAHVNAVGITTTTKTQLAVARITAIMLRLQTAKSSIAVTTNRVMAAVARLIYTTLKTQTGKANIAASSQRRQTITGVANIKKSLVPSTGWVAVTIPITIWTKP